MAYWLAAFWRFLWLHYHRDWVDVGTILTALGYVFYRSVRARPQSMKMREAGRHIMDGATVFPLFLLAISVFSRHVTDALLSASRATLSLAGIFALLAVLQDEQRTDA